MNVRPFGHDDYRTLRDIHARARERFKPEKDSDYPFPANISDFLVIEGIGAAGYRLIPEVTMILEPELHPLVKVRGIELLHEALGAKLTSCGHTEAIASVPPGMVAYRRHLQRLWNWQESWPTLRISDWRR